MISLKKQAFIMGAAGLALTASATSMAAFNLVPNGDLEAGGASWGVEPAGGATFSFEATGGNADGYLRMDNTSAVWGGVAISTDDAAGALLGDFGVVAGGTYDFQFDMKVFAGAGAAGGIKLESWGETGAISDSGDIFVAGSTDWATYSTSYTIDATATRLKIVLLGIDNSSVYGFDNIGIEDGITAVPVPAAAWLFGSALAGLVAVRRTK